MWNRLLNSVGLLILALNILLASCYPNRVFSIGRSAFQWTYADLRRLDPADPVPLGQDLIAFYAHASNDEVSLRLDFLDLDAMPDADIYLAWDTSSGGSEVLPLGIKSDLAWDYLFVIPAAGPVEGIRADGESVSGLGLRILRDPTMDMVIISFRASSMSLNLGTASVEVYTTPVLSDQQADKLGPVRLDGFPPQPVPVLIAFWNVFPASTPAEALRSWDGAHSGPQSARHGLKHLLAGIKANGVPVALLDLKSPPSLSALDYMGTLPEIKQLDRSGLIFAPEVMNVSELKTSPAGKDEWSKLQNIAFEQRISSGFGLQSSNWNYWINSVALESWLWPGCLVFGYFGVDGGLCFVVGVNDYAKFVHTDEFNEQATRSGLAVPFRRLILSVANDQQLVPVLLGGDFSRSTWGNQTAASMTLAYLAAHPWIRPLDKLSLRNFLSLSSATNPPETSLGFIPGSPAGTPIRSGLTTLQIHDQLIRKFLQAPHGRAYDLAWQAYTLIIASTTEQEKLKAGYLGQIGHLLAAADWENNPGQITNCLEDLDWDGQAECVLASPDVFTSFESEGGLLTTAFIRLSDGIHQIIGPSYQFTVGLSDPMLWKFERGIAADPGALGGALQDFTDPWKVYRPYPFEHGIEFVSEDMSMRKRISLLPSGIQFDLVSNSPWTLSIPLALDPWRRFILGWGDNEWLQSHPSGLLAGIKGSIQINLESSLPGDVLSFMTSRPYLTLPENPNQDYTAGHYLPFPMSVFQVSGNSSGTIQLTASKSSR